MARQQEGCRVLGPYRHGERWRIYVVDTRGGRTNRSYETEKEAKQVVRSLRRKLNTVPAKTLNQAIDEYEVYMRHEKGNKMTSAQTAVIWLRHFLSDLDATLDEVTPAEAQALYDRYRAKLSVRTGKPLAVDTHRNALAHAKTFYGWAMKKGYVNANPFEKVEGKGRRKHGKPQLRIDESRKWIATAVRLAEGGDVGAVGAMMTLLLGMRAGEVVNRVVRDVDDGGRLLWIPASKTPAGRRTLEVPGVLQPFLLRLTEGRRPEEKLFGHRWRDWCRKNVARICELSGVPKVCPHSMRGLHGTLAVQHGITGHVVAAALGHESFATTAQSYAKQEALDSAKQQRVLTVLQGGAR